MPEDYEEIARRGGATAVRDIDQFFSGNGPIHITLRRIAGTLDRLGVPYAVIGAMALNAHGYRRATVDVDVAVTPQGLTTLCAVCDRFGYSRISNRRIRDTMTGVRIDLMIEEVTAEPVVIEGIRYMPLARLLERKLAAGTELVRYKHTADVQEAMKVLNLSRDFGAAWPSDLRRKYEGFWDLYEAQGDWHLES